VCFILAVGLGWGQAAPTHDEQRVRGSIPWRALAQGDVSGAAFNALYMTYARPGLFVAFAPAGLASWAIGAPRPPVDAAHDWALDPIDVRCALAMNAVWAALAVLLVGRLGERLGGRWAGALASWWIALSIVVLHQARTLYPPVAALALAALFFELYLQARQSEALGLAVRAGLGLLALLLVYPGAYPLAIVLPVDVLLTRSAARRRVGRVLLTLLGGLLLVEVLWRLFGASYLFELRDLSEGVKIGDPAEGWSYAWEYFGRLDRALGLAVMALALSAPGWARSDEQRLLGWSALALYAWAGLLVSTLLGRQALYGRQVAIWLALLVPLAACFPRAGRRRLAACVLLLGLHQAPGLWRLFSLERYSHPGARYEGLGPEERAAAR
jgi:hypothetical protein